VLLYDPVWLERARESVDPSWFEGAVYRSLFEALAAPGGERYQREQPTGLDDAPQQVWARLKQEENRLDTAGIDDIFARACQTLEARPYFRELDELSSRIRQAPPDEQESLLEERQRRAREVRERYPAEWNRRHLQKKIAQSGSGGRRAH